MTPERGEICFQVHRVEILVVWYLLRPEIWKFLIILLSLEYGLFCHVAVEKGHRDGYPRLIHRRMNSVGSLAMQFDTKWPNSLIIYHFPIEFMPILQGIRGQSIRGMIKRRCWMDASQFQRSGVWLKYKVKWCENHTYKSRGWLIGAKRVAREALWFIDWRNSSRYTIKSL